VEAHYKDGTGSVNQRVRFLVCSRPCAGNAASTKG
jgi:hypothetical protein